MTANESQRGLETWSIITSVIITLLLVILASLSMRLDWLLPLAISAGALGGLVHEFAQSGGKILFFKKYADGFYLGAISGAVLGAVSGLLVMRGHLIASASGQTLEMSTIQLAYEVFIAGLALKGVTEAAGGQQVE